MFDPPIDRGSIDPSPENTVPKTDAIVPEIVDDTAGTGSASNSLVVPSAAPKEQSLELSVFSDQQRALEIAHRTGNTSALGLSLLHNEPLIDLLVKSYLFQSAEEVRSSINELNRLSAKATTAELDRANEAAGKLVGALRTLHDFDHGSELIGMATYSILTIIQDAAVKSNDKPLFMKSAELIELGDPILADQVRMLHEGPQVDRTLADSIFNRLYSVACKSFGEDLGVTNGEAQFLIAEVLYFILSNPSVDSKSASGSVGRAFTEKLTDELDSGDGPLYNLIRSTPARSKKFFQTLVTMVSRTNYSLSNLHEVILSCGCALFPRDVASAIGRNFEASDQSLRVSWMRCLQFAVGQDPEVCKGIFPVMVDTLAACGGHGEGEIKWSAESVLRNLAPQIVIYLGSDPGFERYAKYSDKSRAFLWQGLLPTHQDPANRVDMKVALDAAKFELEKKNFKALEVLAPKLVDSIPSLSEINPTAFASFLDSLYERALKVSEDTQIDNVKARLYSLGFGAIKYVYYKAAKELELSEDRGQRGVLLVAEFFKTVKVSHIDEIKLLVSLINDQVLPWTKALSDDAKHRNDIARQKNNLALLLKSTKQDIAVIDQKIRNLQDGIILTANNISRRDKLKVEALGLSIFDRRKAEIQEELLSLIPLKLPDNVDPEELNKAILRVNELNLERQVLEERKKGQTARFKKLSSADTKAGIEGGNRAAQVLNFLAESPSINMKLASQLLDRISDKDPRFAHARFAFACRFVPEKIADTEKALVEWIKSKEMAPANGLSDPAIDGVSLIKGLINKGLFSVPDPSLSPFAIYALERMNGIVKGDIQATSISLEALNNRILLTLADLSRTMSAAPEAEFHKAFDPNLVKVLDFWRNNYHPELGRKAPRLPLATRAVLDSIVFWGEGASLRDKSLVPPIFCNTAKHLLKVSEGIKVSEVKEWVLPTLKGLYEGVPDLAIATVEKSGTSKSFILEIIQRFETLVKDQEDADAPRIFGNKKLLNLLFDPKQHGARALPVDRPNHLLLGDLEKKTPSN